MHHPNEIAAAAQRGVAVPGHGRAAMGWHTPDPAGAGRNWFPPCP
jgi:hypothetical protein